MDANDLSEIEAEFIASWDYIEQHFNEWNYIKYEGIKNVLRLMPELRKRGYDRTFRAGTSVLRFTLSRSRKYGLRREQALLIFNCNSPSGGMTVEYYEAPDVSIQLKVEQVELTPEVDELLQRLLAQPID